MSLRSFIRSFFVEKANPVWKIITSGQVGQPQWTERDYKALAEASYEMNDIAYSSIELFARNFSQVDYKLFRQVGAERVQIFDHPILDLLHRPNPKQGKSEFLENLAAYRLLSGNPYIHANTGTIEADIDFKSEPTELWLLRPDRMKIVPGENDIKSYKYEYNGNARYFPVDELTGASNILHWKTFNPTNDYYGLSPVQAGARNIDIYNEGQKWNMNFFRNGTRPSGALVYAPKEGTGKLDDQEYNRLKDQMDKEYAGSLNSGKPLLLEGGMDWKSMSMSPKDIDFLSGKNVSSRDIARIFGVPPLLLNIPGDNTYNNMESAKLGLWEESIIPWTISFFSQLNYWIVKRYGEDLILKPDFSDVTALEPRREQQFKRANESSFLTINEKRRMTGYEDVEGGDDVLIQSSLVPLTFNQSLLQNEDKGITIAKQVTKSTPYKLTRKATDEELRREQLIQERLMMTFERSFEQRMFRLLDNSSKEYAEEYEKSGGNVDLDLLVFGDSGEYNQAIANQYDVVFDAFGVRIQQGLKSIYRPFEQKDEAGLLEIAKVEFVGTFTVDRVQKILDTSKKIMADTIAKGVDEGLSVPQIAINVREATGNQIARSRARTIARTETHTAAQAGSHNGALSTGLKLQRIWAHADDGGVRPTHLAAQEESKRNPVPMEASFKVGNSHLLYPGDPTGEAKEIINCRCVIIYEPIT